MDDLVAHVDGGSVTLQSELDDLDCPVDSGAKTAWSGDQHSQFWAFGHCGGDVRPRLQQ
jgi:hypothetical protein